MLTFLWLGAPKNEGTTDSRITAIWGYIDILDRKVVKTQFKEFSVGLGCLQPVELLSEVKNFQGCIASTAKEDSDGDDERSDDFEHELTLVTRRNVAPLCRRCEIRKLLIASHYGHLSTNSRRLATPPVRVLDFLRGQRYLLLDRDTKFCAAFLDVLRSCGIRPVALPPRSLDGGNIS